MEIRAANLADLAGLADIDGTIESAQYLHIERAGEAFWTSWRIEARPARQKIIEPNRMSDDAQFQLKQIVSGNDDGIARVIEHEDSPVAMLLAKVEPAAGTIRLIDLRVDYDYRRQGMGTALVYQLIQHARDSEG